MSLISKYSIIFFCLIIAWLFLILSQPVLAVAPGVQSATGGLDVTAQGGGIKSDTTDLPTIIGRVVGAGLAFIGVVFFCLILWAGFGWMLAKGNEEEIHKAKEVIFGAVLGLIVILGAYAITRLVAMIFSNALTGA